MKRDSNEAFNLRLEALHTARECPKSEIDCAVMIAERLITARAICEAQFGAKFSQTTLLTVFSELCAEARNGQGTSDRP